MRRHVVVILNPVSGRGDMSAAVQAVRRRLERAGCACDIAVTDAAGHATVMTANLAADVEAVLVAGGDGTVCEVANGLVGRNIPIAILRTGTENLVAREFRMPTRAHRVADTLLHGEPVACDVGVANDRRFLAVAGVGFDAECVMRLSQNRQGHITHLDYFWPIWRTFWSHRFPELTVEVDGAVVFQGPGLAMIGNIARYSAGLRILARARRDDGLLDVCVFRCSSRRTLLRHAAYAFVRCHIGRAGVMYTQGRSVRVTAQIEVLIEIDGDLGGCLPLSCSVLPRAAAFLRPIRRWREKG